MQGIGNIGSIGISRSEGQIDSLGQEVMDALQYTLLENAGGSSERIADSSAAEKASAKSNTLIVSQAFNPAGRIVDATV